MSALHRCTHTHLVHSSILSQGALQCVVVVFETFELQKVFGPLAALASGGQVGDLDGGGGAADRRACQVFGCRLVMLVQAGAAGIRFHTVDGEGKTKEEVTVQKGSKLVGGMVISIAQIVAISSSSCYSWILLMKSSSHKSSCDEKVFKTRLVKDTHTHTHTCRYAPV